jgi:hypothetical protein
MRSLLLLLVLPALQLSAAPARAAYRCVMDGVARSHCCCPGRAGADPVHAAVRANCCEIEAAIVVTDTQARTDRDPLTRVRTPLVGVVPAPRPTLAAVRAAAFTRTVTTATPPPPPLILLNCALLL